MSNKSLNFVLLIFIVEGIVFAKGNDVQKGDTLLQMWEKAKPFEPWGRKIAETMIAAANTAPEFLSKMKAAGEQLKGGTATDKLKKTTAEEILKFVEMCSKVMDEMEKLSSAGRKMTEEWAAFAKSL